MHIPFTYRKITGNVTNEISVNRGRITTFSRFIIIKLETNKLKTEELHICTLDRGILAVKPNGELMVISLIKNTEIFSIS